MKRYAVRDGKLVELEGDAVTVVRVAAPGLGDVVAGAARAVGVKASAGCGCEKRRQAMNRWTPAWLKKLLARVKFL